MKKLSPLAGMLACTLALGGCAEEPKQKAVVVDHESPNLPPFKFRGMVTGETTIEEAKQAGTVSDCGQDDGKLMHCKFVRKELDGLPLDDLMSYAAFEDGRFASFVMTFEPKVFARLSVVALDTYGPMCDHPSREYPTRSVWCYKSGLLLVQEPGVFLDNSTSLHFAPHETAEDERPRYTPETI